MIPAAPAQTAGALTPQCPNLAGSTLDASRVLQGQLLTTGPRPPLGLLLVIEPGLLCAVTKWRVLLKYWLPVAGWMVVIFSASGDQHSTQRSSRLIGPFARWLFPEIAEDTLEWVVFWVRKAAHVTEYAILAALVWRALRQPVKHDPRPWTAGTAWLAFLLTVGYAITDEMHQTFVPGRQGAIMDVLLDASGAALALILIWLFRSRRNTR